MDAAVVTLPVGRIPQEYFQLAEFRAEPDFHPFIHSSSPMWLWVKTSFKKQLYSAMLKHFQWWSRDSPSLKQRQPAASPHPSLGSWLLVVCYVTFNSLQKSLGRLCSVPLFTTDLVGGLGQVVCILLSGVIHLYITAMMLLNRCQKSFEHWSGSRTKGYI